MRKKIYGTNKILLIVLAGILFYVALQNLNALWAFLGKAVSVFAPVIAALCIAFILNVLLSALETKIFKFMDKAKKKFVKKLKRPICLLLTYLIAFSTVVLIIWVVIPNMVDTVVYLADKLPPFLADVKVATESVMQQFGINPDEMAFFEVDWNSLAVSLKNWATDSSNNVLGSALGITTSVFSGVFDAIFSIVISVYVLAQKEKIGAFIRRVIDAYASEKVAFTTYYLAVRVSNSFSNFIGGQLLEALILGTLCYIGMLIFSFPNALIVSVIIAATAIVPIIGPTIGVVIGFLLIVVTSPLQALFFVVYILILQQIETNLIYPRVVGKAVGLPAVIVMSAVLVGGNIGGVLGAFIAVPTSAVIYTIINESTSYLSNKKKKLKKIENEQAIEE